MPAAQNKQPLFTSIPILQTSQFDPPIPSTLRGIPGMDAGTVIYTDESLNGSLITRITVTATGLKSDTVTTKIIYLGIQDTNTEVKTLYQSKVMTGISGLTNTDIVPYVVFEFGGGLVMNRNSGKRLVIAASDNRGNTGESGDEISVVVEGGTYDAI